MIEPVVRTQNSDASVIGGKSMQTGGGRIDLGINEPFGFTHTDGGAGSIIVIGDPSASVTAQVLTGKGLGATAYDTGTAYTNAVLNSLLRNPSLSICWSKSRWVRPGETDQLFLHHEQEKHTAEQPIVDCNLA